jgi:hypothetical protein
MAPGRSHLWDSCLFTINPSHPEDRPASAVALRYEALMVMDRPTWDLIVEMGPSLSASGPVALLTRQLVSIRLNMIDNHRFNAQD